MGQSAPWSQSSVCVAIKNVTERKGVTHKKKKCRLDELWCRALSTVNSIIAKKTGEIHNIGRENMNLESTRRKKGGGGGG